MEQFVIEGGKPLRGEMTPGGNKNAATKMIPACLLTDDPVTLHNVPDIVDVRVLIDALREMGAVCDWQDKTTLRITCAGVTTNEVPASVGRTRAGVVLSGAMLARAGAVSLPLPGGDVIGERRLDTLVDALRRLGAEVTFKNGVHMRADKRIGTDILLREASVTATENTILAAVTATGTTIIRNAASEPHVQNLCAMLNTMGAQIEGVGSNRLVITGVDGLGGAEVRIGADYMEVGSYVGAAVVTGGEITVRNADPQHLDMVALVFEKLGVTWEVRGDDIFVAAGQRLTVEQDIGGRIPVIKAQPWPAFPADLMSIALVVATQSAGVVMFHDWMYESRFFFTDKLVRMGARITLCDPHRVLVQGPTALRGAPDVASPDIRAGMAILIAALAARGETRISNIHQIDRGYADVEHKLAALGAKIHRVAG